MAVLETKRVIQPPKRRRMNKRTRIIQMCLRVTVLASLAVLLGVLIYMVGFAKYTTVNLGELTTAELIGYEGHGTLRTSTYVMPGYEQFFETVKVDIVDSDEAPNGTLSNGDKIELEYSYDKKMAKSLGLKVHAKDEYVTVKNLPEGKVLSVDDLFAGINISYEGVAPLLSVTMENNTTDEVLKTVEFEVVNPKDYYDNGEAVQVQATFDSALLAANAYEVQTPGNSVIKEYVVSSPDRYITDASELPDDLLEQMKSYGATLFGTESGDANEFGLRVFSDAGLMYTTENTKYTFRFTGARFISAYFCCVEDEHAGEVGTHINDVKIVYDTGVSQSDGQSVAAEAVVIFRDVIKKADGTVTVDMNSGEIISVSRRDAQIKELVYGTEDDQYTSTKLER